MRLAHEASVVLFACLQLLLQVGTFLAQGAHLAVEGVDLTLYIADKFFAGLNVVVEQVEFVLGGRLVFFRLLEHLGGLSQLLLQFLLLALQFLDILRRNGQCQ